MTEYLFLKVPVRGQVHAIFSSVDWDILFMELLDYEEKVLKPLGYANTKTQVQVHRYTSNFGINQIYFSLSESEEIRKIYMSGSIYNYDPSVFEMYLIAGDLIEFYTKHNWDLSHTKMQMVRRYIATIHEGYSPYKLNETHTF